ncbi:MAG: cyclase family protein [Acidobacteria bacterium]|nr:cyclase family protein [Acidobacteriota bacterium]
MVDVGTEWIDISTPLTDGMPHWPGDPEVHITTAEQDGVRLTTLSMCAHTGTHMDAPRHYLAGGAAIDHMPPETAIGPARVVDTLEDCRPGERILLKGATPAVDDARRLAQCGVRLLGVESLSVGPGGPEGDEIHRLLLAAGVWILEGLDLRSVACGEYELLCLPLRIAGADGAPARAFLRRTK